MAAESNPLPDPPPPSGVPAEGRGPSAAAWRRLGVFVAAIVVFLSALGNGFVNMDDPRIILEQPFLQRWTWANLWTCVSPFPVREEFLPLRDLTYMVHHGLHGARPLGFVLGNLLFHAGTAVLVTRLGERLLPRALPTASASQVGRLAFLAGLLFALHPIHVESVAWISGRKDVMSGVFVLLTVLAYLDHLEANDEASARRAYAWTVAFTVAALGSKATAVSLPLVLVALDALLFPARTWGARLRALAPLFVLVGLFALGYTRLLQAFGEQSGDFVAKRHPESAAVAIALTDAHVFRQYLQRLLLPVGQLLFSDQGYQTTLTAQVGASLALVLAALAGTGALIRRAPVAGLLALWFWLTLAPWNLFPHGILYGERYLYLPSIGFCLLLPLLLFRVVRAERRVALLLTPLLLLCGVQCARLAAVFKTGETLWSHVAAAEPTNAAARMNLANYYLGSDPAGVAYDAQRAEALYREALVLAPHKASIHYNLGLLAESQGKLDEALERYAAADRRRPRGHLKAVLSAAGVLARQRRYDVAEALYRKIAEGHPQAQAQVAWERALMWGEAGRRAEEVAALERFLELVGSDPRFAGWAAEARRRLGRG